MSARFILMQTIASNRRVAQCTPDESAGCHPEQVGPGVLGHFPDRKAVVENPYPLTIKWLKACDALHYRSHRASGKVSIAIG
jgi:hypothetical protein